MHNYCVGCADRCPFGLVRAAKSLILGNIVRMNGRMAIISPKAIPQLCIVHCLVIFIYLHKSCGGYLCK